jgi:hypothetical protein
VNREPFRLVSRPLALGWCIWLLSSWLLGLAINPLVMATVLPDESRIAVAERLVPVVHVTMQMALLGVMVVWPVFRLSHSPPARVALRLGGDLLVLWAVFQVALWPLGYLSRWPVERVLAIDAILMTWSVPIALWIYLGWRGARVEMIVACLACVLTWCGPVLWALGAGQPGPAHWAAPMMMRHAVVLPNRDYQLPFTPLLVVAVVGLLGWLTAWWSHTARCRRTPGRIDD